MLELIIVSHTLIPINTDTYLSILYKDTVQMCISTLVSDIEKSHMASVGYDSSNCMLFIKVSHPLI